MIDQTNTSDPRRDTRRKVLRYARYGWTGTRIATKLGISPQRVYQHLASLRAEGLLP